MWGRDREPKPCTVCLRDEGQQPTGGKLCAEHQSKHDRFVSAGTSWTASLLSLFTEPETCVMYEGINDDVIIVSNRELQHGRRARMIPVRTIGELEVIHRRAGNTITIRTRGGETWRIPHLRRNSSLRLRDTVQQRLQEMREQQEDRDTQQES